MCFENNVANWPGRIKVWRTPLPTTILSIRKIWKVNITEFLQSSDFLFKKKRKEGLYIICFCKQILLSANLTPVINIIVSSITNPMTWESMVEKTKRLKFLIKLWIFHNERKKNTFEKSSKFWIKKGQRYCHMQNICGLNPYLIFLSPVFSLVVLQFFSRN